MKDFYRMCILRDAYNGVSLGFGNPKILVCSSQKLPEITILEFINL